MRTPRLGGIFKTVFILSAAIAIIAAYGQAQTLPAGTVAAYGFNEGSGTVAADVSGLQNTGTISNASWTTSGRFGRALTYNGSSSRVNVGNSSSLALTNAMTLEAWVFPTSTGNRWRTVIMKERPRGFAYALFANTNGGRPGVYLTIGGTSRSVTGPAALARNVWTHLAATYNGSSLRLYINGNQVATLSLSGNIAVSSNALRIGGSTTLSNRYFAGRIDEVRIYNRALTQQEIRADMNARVPEDTIAPTAPGSLTVAPGGTQVALSWTASTDNSGVTGYQVERCQGEACTSFALVTTVTGTSYQNTGLQSGATYRYRVRARDAAGNFSSYSDIVTVVTRDANSPTAPGSFTATPLSETEIDLSWAASTDNVGVTEYRVERCQGASCTNFAALTAVTGTSHRDTGLSAWTTYRYRVRAVDAAGNLSSYSAVISPRTLDSTSPTAPGNLTAVPQTANQIRLTWSSSSDNVGVTGYAIESCQGTGCSNFSPLATVPGTSYSGAASITTSQSYRVRATDAAGNFSAYSAVVTWVPSVTLNPIVQENSLPGNPSSEWDIDGAGDQSIQGFATDISVNKGETVHFKVDTDAEDYSIRIYRLGYYSGMGARHVATVTPHAPLPQAQPACLTDDSVGLIDCGNWAESAFWNVPADAVSGIYIGRLVRSDTGGASHIVFIVRDDSGNSDLLFKASDSTWQAYNPYGGKYIEGNNDGPSRIARKSSYNRPFLTRERQGGMGSYNWLFHAEYPMIRWLEANGYDVSYFATVDAARYGSEILEHKVLLSVGHDEYWSAAERANVEGARNAGVHLAFFSGNSIYRKTRWEPSIDGTGTNYRTLVCYKESNNNPPLDPEYPAVWTGSWRDPRFSPPADGGRPENALSGTLFTSMNEEDSVPLEVPEPEGKMRFWRNTAVANLSPGQKAVLGAHVVGYEFDEDIDNGHRPAGLMRLSSTTTPTVGRLLGSNINIGVDQFGPGPGTHVSTLYKTSSGSLVFSAGTVQWSFGLDGEHDGNESVPDLSIQQATVNLFADMGVQPVTLQAGLTAASASTDNAAPVSVIAFPRPSQVLDRGTLSTITGTASDSGGVVAAVEVSVDNGVTWHPAVGRETWEFSWIPDRPGPVTIRSRAVDDTGNIETAGEGVTVIISGPAPPPGTTIWSDSAVPIITSDPDATPIEVGVKFRSDAAGYITGLRFYKGEGNAGPHVGHLWSADGALLAAVTFTGETASGWQYAAFPTPVPILADTTYVASYFAPVGHYSADEGYFSTAGIDNPPLHVLADGVDGRNGVYRYYTSDYPYEGFRGSNYWVDVYFQSTLPPDTVLPDVVAVYPAADSSGVDPRVAVTATFSEGLSVGTVNPGTCALFDSSGNRVDVHISYSAVFGQITLTPVSMLAYLQGYTAVIKGGPDGVKDLAGNPLESDFSWTFITSAPPPPLADSGPGGPILVVASSVNPFTSYYAEILRAEGFTSYLVTDVANLTPARLQNHSVAILGEVEITESQAAILTDWVNSGGNLIAMRPDVKLAPLLGLAPSPGTLSNAYILVNTASGPGYGIVGETIQFHGAGDLYSVVDAAVVAAFYSDAATPTPNPAITLRSVGESGGQAAAFAYDLAKSVVYTRQGNPAWSGQDRDGRAPIRSDDLFFGTGGEPDWVDLNKVAIPQADEQQRLLANLVVQMSFDLQIIPRFWYLPRGLKAAIIMSGDDHGSGGMIGRFENHISRSSPSCSVDNWECIRATSYIEDSDSLPPADAAYYESLGFEIARHIDTDCSDWTPSSLEANYREQIAQFLAEYPGLHPPATNRTHCIVWSDYDTQPQVELRHGIRLDTNYYYWPSSWVNNRPGFFTGSGIPMRFAKADGTLIDVYQAATQMTDESDQEYPCTVDQLLDKALGPEGYYGVFTANMHTDVVPSPDSDSIISSAIARSVPVVTARQMLQWLDSRGDSLFTNLDWNGTTLHFSVVTEGSTGLTGMVPVPGNRQFVGITRDGFAIDHVLNTVKGVDYAMFEALPGNYQVVFTTDTIAPEVIAVSPLPGTTNIGIAANVVATFSESVDPAFVSTGTFDLRDPLGDLIPATVSYDTAGHTAVLNPAVRLDGFTAYTARIKGGPDGIRDLGGNTMPADYSWSFTTGAFEISIWDDDAIPATITVQDPNAVELGVKFRSDVPGYVSGIKFYKGPQNTGTHTGRLWSSNGALLASVTFTDETDFGWQYGRFDAPVRIQANTTYVASYHTDTGFYSASSSYFSSSEHPNPPLTALANDQDGGNGVYRYGTSAFPRSSYNSTNYWVDVLFEPSSFEGTIWDNSTVPASITVDDPSPIELGLKFRSGTAGTITAIRFYKGPQNTGPHVGSLWAADGTLLATVSFAGETGSGWQQADFSVPVAILPNTTYVVSYHTDSGYYSANPNYFAVPYLNSPLSALADGEDGPNGVYRYGVGGFPDQTYRSTNYWVDVVFIPNP